MGIIDRFSSIMSANINALLDKCEDESKMVDQTLRDLKESYAEVKQNTAEVLAVEKKRKRELDDLKDKIQDYSNKAEKAVMAGNDDDARILLEEVANLESKIESAQQRFDVAHMNATKMRQMHDKLADDIKAMEERRADVKSNVSMAKATEKVAKAMDSVDSTKSAEAFARYEQKAQDRLDTAMARAELNEEPKDAAADVAAKYGGSTANSAVEDRLAALKAKCGK